MTAELWLYKPCADHGIGGPHQSDNYNLNGWCPGGSRVRLDPEREVMFLASNESGEVWYLAPIREIIDALEDE